MKEGQLELEEGEEETIDIVKHEYVSKSDRARKRKQVQVKGCFMSVERLDGNKSRYRHGIVTKRKRKGIRREEKKKEREHVPSRPLLSVSVSISPRYDTWIKISKAMHKL